MNNAVEEFATRKDIPHRLAEYVPIVAWLPRYESGWLRFDLLAGLTAAAVVIPQAMAYASIAGLPVQAGLYTALTPMLIYALLGTSRRLSVSSTSTISGLVATELALVVQDGGASDYLIAATTLALLVGLFLVLASLLRLGFVANFISLPVLTGAGACSVGSCTAAGASVEAGSSAASGAAANADTPRIDAVSMPVHFGISDFLRRSNGLPRAADQSRAITWTRQPDSCGLSGNRDRSPASIS